MKLVRLLVIALGVMVVVVAAGLALALVPSIQRRVIFHFAANQPGLKIDIAHVAAGFSSVALSGVQVELQGLKVNIEQLDMDYSLWPALFNHRLSIRRLNVAGLTVDASRLAHNKAQAAVAAAPVATPGLLAEVQLPFELVLDDCQLAGRILVAGSMGQPPFEAVFDLKGGKFSPGEEGALRLTATVKNPAVNADVGTLHAQLSLRATQTTQRGFSRVNLTAVVNAVGPALSEQNQLKITTDLGKETTGENYSLSVATLIHGATENLLALRATLPTGGNEYTGTWTLKARDAQLEPFFLGLPLPNFDARGEGRLTYAPATSATGLQGNLEVGASRLEVINPSWKAMGPVKLQTQFDVTAEGAVARLRQLTVMLSGEKPVLELSASQAAEVNFNERRFRVGGVAAGEGLNLKLRGVPLAWIAPFVPTMKISGGALTGEFAISGGADRMLLRGIQPLQIDQLTITQQEETLLSKAAITLALDAVLTDKELQAKVSDFTLRTPAGDMLKSQLAVSIPVTAHPPVSIQASYTADLPALLTPWLPKGHIKAEGNTDLSWADGKIELRKLTTNLTDEKGGFLFKATALRSFIFDPATQRTVGEKSPVDLAQIGIGRIPLDWLPLNEPGRKLNGTIEPGELVLKVEGEKLFLRAVQPIKMSDVSLAQDGQSALIGLAVETFPSFELAGGVMTVRTGDVSVRNAAGLVLLTLKGEAVQSNVDGTQATATFNMEIPSWASQPFFAGTKSVLGGRASGEVRATLGTTQQMEARLTLNGLVAREGGQLLPVANLSFRATIQDNGKISIQAPLLLDRAGQRSDLNFALDLTPSSRSFILDGKLTGDHVELTDAIALLGVFSSSAAHAAQEQPPASSEANFKKSVPDAVSAWSRFNGQLLLDIKSAAAGKEWSITAITGLVTIDPSLVSLKKLEAAFSEKSRLAAKAEMKFEVGQQPYQLAGDFSLTEFDAGKLFKAIEPAKPPTVEGLFNITGHLMGGGETMESTISRTHGQFELTSRQGIFRGLQRATGKVSATSKAVEMGASVLGSLFGSEKVTKAAEKVAGQAYFVDQLAQSVSEFNYDQLNVRLVRDEALNLSLEDISLLSPEIRLLGKGSVTHVEGKPLLEQPMNITLSFAARGKVEQLLGKLRLTDGTRDEVGYAKTKEAVTIGGSLAKPDPTAFFAKIATARINDLLDAD